MSYILDALKRADAERERGTVPGLHVRQVSAPAPAAAPGPRPSVWLAGAVGLLLLGGVAAGVWKWQAPADDERVAAVAPALASPPVVVLAPAATVQPAPAVPAPVSAPTPMPPAVPQPASPPAAPPSAKQPASARPQAIPAPPPAVAPATPRPVSKPASKSLTLPADAASAAAIPPLKPEAASPTPAPVPPAAPASIALLSELPEAVRRQVPPLNITGSVYSGNPAQRLLLVNNLVLSEGSQVAPGMTLEQIRRKSSVFSFQGTRFQVAH